MTVTSNPRLGVGFVGAGAVTQAIHLPTLARLTDDFVVRRIFDVSEYAAAAVAARVGASTAASLEELLADPEVDVVAVCSPHHLHAVQVIAACRAGKRAVLCEKPFATTPEEAEAIAAVSAETGVPVLVGAMHTFDPGWRAAVQAWGDLPAAAFAISSSIVLPPNPRFEDFATEVVDRAPAGGRALLDSSAAQAELLRNMVLGLTIHDLPLIRSILPTVDDLAVLEAKALRPHGYYIVLGVAGRRIELFGLGHDSWRPSWLLEITAPAQQLRTDFTPSYVHAGSATSVLSTSGEAVVYGPYASNGYEAEWRQLGEIARGERPAPDPTVLIDDLRFALAIAAAAADFVHSSPRQEVLA